VFEFTELKEFATLSIMLENGWRGGLSEIHAESRQYQIICQQYPIF